jgi:hypothetical protein
MPYSTVLKVVLTSLLAGEMHAEIREALAADIDAIIALVARFGTQAVTPASAAQFESELADKLRELGRRLLETTVNRLEPAAQTLPATVRWEATDYRRLNQATPNRHVATLFGTITLWRHGYRPSDKDSAEATIFPLEQALGLVESATPAMAGRIGVCLAEAGATQERVLERLRREHGVSMGVKRLRALAASLSEEMTEQRHACQVEQVLKWLAEAQTSRGRNKPVLCAGRDGITLGQQPWGFFEVASVATLTVYDRARRRLGTVQLACVPEYGQGTLTTQLTRLIEDVLRGWTRPLPRLCYVTDAGDNETGYYRHVLRRQRHPLTGKKLTWHWIVDYYHATERISVLAAILFGSGSDGESREGRAWAKKMRKLLLKPSGVRRVLLSAAALRGTRGVKSKQQADYRRAYNYLRNRSRHMQYHEFRRQGLPIGSGVTEAACKTVFTQRLKLSGMRWKKEGAQVILNLRVILLSGIWDATRKRVLESKPQPQTPTHSNFQRIDARLAA